jgi:hypothetical protein
MAPVADARHMGWFSFFFVGQCSSSHQEGLTVLELDWFSAHERRERPEVRCKRSDGRSKNHQRTHLENLVCRFCGVPNLISLADVLLPGLTMYKEAEESCSNIPACS